MEFDYIEKEQELIENIRNQGMNEDVLHQFTIHLISFYQFHRRELPWRTTTDPYCILVSEMMLQQTQVDRVIPKYINFVALFPDFAILAAASQKDVLCAWQGLGYNRRAQALHSIAHRVMDTYSGTLPSSVEELTKFPGIGKATASAIIVYAYNMPLVFIETNIRRVFIHFFFQDSHHIPDDRIEPLVAATLWKENPRDWYNSLMDYGSLLKNRVPNPNVRSSVYQKQSPFQGSDRQLRGQILTKLLTGAEMTEEALAKELQADPARLAQILSAMHREGLITSHVSQWKV
jgi:A/G-specific adenine glycosylase